MTPEEEKDGLITDLLSEAVAIAFEAGWDEARIVKEIAYQIETYEP